MGIKDLWSVLTPHATRKPISELRGKIVAIDLAGWVCESLNVVDYFVHPRHHLKNLFFRTCYLIWEEVTPVFVLEGVAPKLKSQIIAKRNDMQFRGVKPKEKDTQNQNKQPQKDKGRTRFNHVLKQCETLLQAMGIQCVQGPGEAEAYCAFLNKIGLVDGVISQDSDCFAYGAIRVFRNFSVSSQGAQMAQGGAVDIYDMNEICQKFDFGQHKVIAMGLLCGCDYCPDGIGGIGRDGVLKLFNIYKETEILNRLRSWRLENTKYTALEMRVEDKSICSNCGHLGRTQSHTKSGCGICRTNRGCDESLWKEERLAIKAELAMRKKAISDVNFPCEEIIEEFLTEPSETPTINLCWKQPNIVKFIKQIGHLLQWPEIYCFQKFLPILTRWHVRNLKRLEATQAVNYIELKEIVKKRNVKGVQSLEVIWSDAKNIFKGLIPEDQLKDFEKDNPLGLQKLWCTVEPLNMITNAYPEMVEAFIKSKEKPAKLPKKTRKKKVNSVEPLGSLENLNDLIKVTNEIVINIKPKRAARPKGVQLINKFFKQKVENMRNMTPVKNTNVLQCSTPVNKLLLSDLDSDCDDAFNMSDIVNGIINKSIVQEIKTHAGRQLYYEPVTNNLSLILKQQCTDDLDLLLQKRRLSISKALEEDKPSSKRQTLDDSFDVLVNNYNHKCKKLLLNSENLLNNSLKFNSFIEDCKEVNSSHNINKTQSVVTFSEDEIHDNNISFFFDQKQTTEHKDEFEKVMDYSFAMDNIADGIEISD